MQVVGSLRAGYVLILLAGTVIAMVGVGRVDPAISGFTVAPDLSAATIHATTGNVHLPLSFTNDPERQVAESGPFTVEYYPPSLYDKLGSPSPGTVLLVSDLPYVATVNEVPGGTAGMERPMRLWPDDLPQSVESLYGSFDALNDSTLPELCDERRSGTWTFQHMASQECFVWCTGYARMSAAMLRTMGQPARLIDLSGFSATLPSGVLVQTSESHTTVERWNGERWVWIDPTFRVRDATLDGRALSAHEVIVALANSDTREAVTFTRWINGAWVTARYGEQEDDFRAALARYFTGDKKLAARR